MLESNEEILPKDPSLKRYFKYMLVNRKMSVQFTSKKIREIIENDLNIKLESNSVYSKMCIDAFAYYMQSWPNWHIAVKSVYSDELYKSLIIFLQKKLMELKNRENMPLGDKTEHRIPLPDQLLQDLRNKITANNKIFTLNINIPTKLWNKTDVAFKSATNFDILMEFEKIKKSSVLLSDSDVINHPYVLIEFKVPGLINIQRSSPFKTDRYLHNYTMFPSIEAQFIHTIKQTNPLPNPKIFTHRVLNSFFSKLKNVLETNYSTAIGLSKRIEILTLCDQFLSDVFESNICNATICEGYHIDFNMSRRSYFVNHLVSQKTSDNMLVYKKTLIPIISYSLINCSLQQDDITKDGYTFFKFMGDIDKTFEAAFLHYLINSMAYKCILCDTYYNLYELKQHLMETHPLEIYYKCTKCFKSLPVKQLLLQRWNHECCIIINTIIS